MNKILIICLIVASLLIPITAFAATNEGAVVANNVPPIGQQFQKPNLMPKIDVPNLTDAQKKIMEDQHIKMITLQKETIALMILNGIITKEQGDLKIAEIDKMEINRLEKGKVPFPPMGNGIIKPNMPPKNDVSKLTEEQMKVMQEQQGKMLVLQKETITLMISNGIITNEQGEKMYANLDNMIKNPFENGNMKPNMPPKKEMPNLTDAQKSDLEAQHAKMIALKKETIDIMVANGTITKEQGDKMLTNIDNVEKNRIEKGIVPFPGMGKGEKGFGEGKKGRIRGCPNIGQQSPIPTA